MVVWEPVLITDLAPPSTGVLSRLSDTRAAQFWDKELRLSRAMIQTARKHQLLSDEEIPGEGDIVWDFVAIYPPGVTWEELPPVPAYYGYPVVDVIDEVRARLVPPAVARTTPATGACRARPPRPPA